jgi:hypothetical protein
MSVLNTCPVCQLELPNVETFRDHVAHEHEDYKHFACELHIAEQPCTARYKYKKDLVAHQKRVIHDQVRHYVSPAYHQLRLRTKHATSWGQWTSLYVQYKSVSDPVLSNEYKVSVEQVMIKLKEEEWWMDEALYDSWQFEEMIEQLENYWSQQQQKMDKTVGNQLRLVFWYTLYMFCIHDTITDTVVHFLHKRVSKYFMKATKIVQGSLGVQIMDPYQMVELRHRILLELQKQQQTTIDPFIKQFLHERSPKMPLMEFGTKLRCWIDLIIRFMNIPMRIQATKELHLGYPFRKTEASEHHVARLLYENGNFTRLFMFDKVGKTGYDTIL